MRKFSRDLEPCRVACRLPTIATCGEVKSSIFPIQNSNKGALAIPLTVRDSDHQSNKWWLFGKHE